MTVAFGMTETGCASLPPECKTEYAHTIMACGKQVRQPKNGDECKQAGGVPIYVDGRYDGCASKDELREILRRL